MKNLSAKVISTSGDFIFDISNNNEIYELFYSESPSLSNLLLLHKGSENKIIIQKPSNKRLFFKLVSGNDEFNFSTRLIDNVNVENFRDLGGYKTSDEKTVKWGLLYRSAHYNAISEDDQMILKSMELNTIFDLRSKKEVAQRPDIVPDGINYHHHSGIVSMDAGNDPLNKEENANLDMSGLALKYAENPEMLDSLSQFLPDGYKLMGENPKAFIKLFETIKNEPGQPLVFHCSAGKDRTGFAASLMLSLLGVPKETVLKDYMLSNYYRKNEIESYLKRMNETTDNKDVLNVVEGMVSVSPSLLEITYNTIDENYGSLDSFFKDVVELNSDDIDYFKNIYLE